MSVCHTHSTRKGKMTGGVKKVSIRELAEEVRWLRDVFAPELQRSKIIENRVARESALDAEARALIRSINPLG